VTRLQAHLLRATDVRTPRYCVYYTLGVAFLLFQGLPIPADEKLDSKRVLKLFEVAYDATSKGLQSGVGTGTFEYRHKCPSEKEFVVVQKARFKASFDEKRFNMRFDYEKDERGEAVWRIIIYDGTAILVSWLPKFGVVRKPQAELYDITAEGTPPYDTGLMYSPARLQDSILDWNTIRADSARYSTVSFSSKANGQWTGSLDIHQPARLYFQINTSSGYHVSSTSFTYPGDAYPVAVRMATWECKGGIWFIKRFEHDLNMRDGSRDQYIINYDSFEPNVKVPKELFEFSAAQLVLPSRIMDRRPGAPAEVIPLMPSKRK
jgi:hypothetical protein